MLLTARVRAPVRIRVQRTRDDSQQPAAMICARSCVSPRAPLSGDVNACTNALQEHTKARSKRDAQRDGGQAALVHLARVMIPSCEGVAANEMPTNCTERGQTEG